MVAVTFLILSVVLASVSAQSSVAPECLKPPKVNPEECCPKITPPYINNGAQCGLSQASRGPPSCEIVKCTMKDYISDDKLDQSEFLSVMKSYYDDYSAVDAAFKECISLESSSGPCPLARFGGCFAMEMFKSCPDNGDSECTDAKEFVKKCAPPKN